MKKNILNHKLLILVNIVFVVAVSVVEALQAILFKTIVDTATGTLSYNIATLAVYSILFLLSVFIFETSSKVSSAALNKAVMIDYKQSIIESFIGSDSQKRVTSSELISLLNNDIKVIEDNYLKSIISIFKDVLLFIVSLFLLLRINIYLTLVIIAFGWIPVVIPQLFIKKNQALKGKYLEDLERFVNRIKEIAQGFEVIKGFNIEEKVCTVTLKDNSDAEISKFKSDAFDGFQGAISIVSGFAIFFMNLLISGYFVMKGNITVGSMIAAVQLMNYIVNPLISISMYVTKIKSVDKVIEKIQEKLINNNIQDVMQGNKEFKLKNIISIEGLTYSYEDQKDVISNISMKLEKGKKYAIVGESGCGKTTLLKILMNQITDYQGEIIFDDENIRSFDPKSYYKKVTLIQQNVFMFRDTLKNNICLYNDCTEEQLNKALKQSGLTKTVSMHQEGLDTIVGEGGVELSGGELKRVAIARALIRESEILLVDEATSALDKVMASEIESTLINLDATILAITHQLDENILSKYNEILVMKDGKITESGNLEKLIENKGYFYYMFSIGNNNSAMELQNIH